MAYILLSFKFSGTDKSEDSGALIEFKNKYYISSIKRVYM